MATNIELALMAGDAYESTRKENNRFPIPTNWASVKHETENSGFEAVTFVRVGTTLTTSAEIVISYAGTYDKSGADLYADENLIAGISTDQLLQAAQYYLDVKARAPSGASITLTGHSLGGGLAALMAVFFNENAITFDQAPFANAARSFNDRDVAATLLSELQAKGYGVDALSGLSHFLQLRQTSGFSIPNADKVRNIVVQGEMLSVPPATSLDRIGQTKPEDIILNTATGAASSDLHAQALLTAFLQSQASNADYSLNKVTDKLPDLLKLMFEKSLFAHRTDEANDDEHKNLLEHLVRNEVLPEGNKMVTRFTADLWRLAQEGGLTMDDGLAYPEYSGEKPASHFISKALMAFAMQKYYNETDHSKGLFNSISGGVSFSMGDVAPSWGDAKGKQYFDSYLANEFNGLSPTERDAISAQLTKMKDWFVQAGTGAMTATATTKEAFMLGGTGVDTLTGGSAADLLVGNAGNDILNGGAGNDTLLGGAGSDTYHFTGAFGKDTIQDSDGSGTGHITLNGTDIGVAKGFGKPNQYKADLGEGGTAILSVFADSASSTGYRLVIAKEGDSANTITVKNFDLNAAQHGGYLGITIEPMRLALEAAGTATPFAHDTPVANLNATFTEGGGGGYKAYLDQAAKAGDTITLSASGASDKISAILGDTTVAFSGGQVTLTLTEGQTEVAFAIVNSADLEANVTATVTAQYRGADGSTAGSNSAALNLQNPDDTSIYVRQGDQLWNTRDGNTWTLNPDGTLSGSGASSKPNANDEMFLGYGDDATKYGQVSGSPDVMIDGALTMGGEWVSVTGVKLQGMGGNDVLTGMRNHDVLEGGDGDDVIFGGLGADQIQGGAGNDVIMANISARLNDDAHLDANATAWTGATLDTGYSPGSTWAVQQYLDGALNMTSFFMTGSTDNFTSNTLTEDAQGDVVHAGAGEDYVWGGLGDDHITGDAGADRLFGLGGNDLIEGGDQDDMLYGDSNPTPGFLVVELDHAANLFHGGVHPYQIIDPAVHGSDFLDGGAGNDLMLGDGQDDVLYGGTGNDLMHGDNYEADLAGQYHGNDYLNGEEGDDQLEGGGRDDVLYGGAGDDHLWGDDPQSLLSGQYHGNDYLDGGDGNDFLVGGGKDDVLLGGAGNDFLWGDDNIEELDAQYHGNDYLDGGAGDDQMDGGAGDDILLGGDGNDLLIGGAGADYMDGGAGNDTYQIDDEGDVIVEVRSPATPLSAGLRMQAMAESNTTTVPSVTSVQAKISYTLGDALDNLTLIGEGAINATGNTYRNLLYGNVAANVLSGGGGDDYLSGGAGNDVYVFNRGDGMDAIGNTDFLRDTEHADMVAAVDTLKFGSGIDDTQVLVYQSGDSVTFAVKGSTDTVVVQNYFGADVVDGTVVSDQKIDRVEFSNGVVWDQTMIQILVNRARDNHTPVATGSIAPLSARVESPFSYAIPVDTVTDGDAGDSIAYSMTLLDGAALPAWLTFDPVSRTLSGVPNQSDMGAVQLAVWGTDNYGQSAAKVVNLSVGAADQAPIVLAPVPQLSVVRASAFTYTVPEGTFGDPEGDALAWTATCSDGLPLPSWLSFDSSSRIFSGTPPDVGTEDVRVMVTDSYGKSAWINFGIEVLAPQLVGTAGDDYLTGSGGADEMFGLGGNDQLHGGDGNDTLVGGDGQDTLYGENGDDVLYSSSISTWMTGGTGLDTYKIGASGVHHIGPSSDVLAQDIIEFDASIRPQDVIVRKGGAFGTASLLVTTGSILGVRSQVVVDGLFGSDAQTAIAAVRFASSPGTVWSQADLQRLAVTGGRENDTLTGLDFLNNAMSGGAGDDILIGGTGNDRLDGGLGRDILQGGQGDDTYLFQRGGSQDTIFDTGGTDTLKLGAGITAAQLTLTRTSGAPPNFRAPAASYNGGDSLVISISGGNDQIWMTSFFEAGTQGIEFIEFADGTLWNATAINARVINAAGTVNAQSGTSADDTFTVDHRSDTVTEAANAGMDTVLSSVSFKLSSNVENLTLTGALNAVGLGNDGDNVITGNAADNVLDGLWGVDTLVGGAGDDVYRIVDTLQFYQPQDSDRSTTPLDTVIEQANGGVDTLVTNQFRLKLPDNVENLLVVSPVATGISFSGNGKSKLASFLSYDDMASNDLRSWYIGNTQDNLIDATNGGMGGIRQSGFEGVLLDGAEGADMLIGGAENDWYVVDNVGDVVIETGIAPWSYDVVTSSTISLNAIANVEVLELNGELALNATGDAGNNDLRGSKNSAVNVLAGMGGDDTYFIDSSDVVVENADGGVDTIVVDVVADSNAWMTHGKTFSLADYANVENIAANGDIYRGVPSYMGVHLVGNAGNNVVSGSFHDDILEGGAGDDLVEDSYSAIVKANGPLNGDTDSLFGGDGNDRLISWSGNDRLDGGTGDDTLDGGSGNDVLDGGTGNDVVLFGIDDGQDILKQQAADSNPSALNILRFKSGVGAADVLVKRWGGNLELSIAGREDKILVQGFYANNTALHANNPMQRIEFADGTTWNLAQIEQLASTDFNVAPPTLAQPLVDMAFAPGDIAYVVPDTAFMDADADDALSYTATLVNGDALPAWLHFNANTLTFAGTSETIGKTSITVTATDKAGGSISDTFDMVISVPNLILNGTSAADTLIGGAGNDILNGGAGNDTLIGAGGNDTYVVDSAGDVVTEAVNEGVDLVQSSVTYTLAANVENLMLTGTAGNATGNALNNELTGNASANILDGGAGADLMAGGLGNDTYVVDDAGDVVTENLNEGTDLVRASLSYTLSANLENLTLSGNAAINGTGNAFANIITGNSANNSLDGGMGADTLVGGAGNDTYYVDNVGDVTTEAVSAGTDLVVSSVNWTLATNLENLTLAGTENLNGVGNAIANTIIGNVGNNILDGGAANDTLVGGMGDDTYVVDSASDVVTEAANEGVDLVQSNVTYTLSANMENITLTGTAAVNATGNALDNVLKGNSAANVLTGGAGNDTYMVGTGDSTIELANGGIDTVQSSVTWALGTEVENLILTGTAAINGTGNTLNNVLTGNSAVNTLNGGTGADTMAGGAGNDIYVVDNAGDVVTENLNEGTDLVQASVTYTLSANVENLTLTGTAAINGTGNTLNNALTGNTGNNVLDGGTGADTMVGGTGNDTYVVDNAGDITTEAASAGTDTVISSINWTLGTNLENLTLSGSANIAGTGNTVANVLTGNAGDNVLNGGAGIDTMIGGLGNDTYVVDVATDVVTEGLNAGTDLVQSGVTYTLGANVENLTLTGTTAINGTGNTADNVLWGNTGANTLTGNAGNDTLDGKAGADILVGGTGNDSYWLGRGYGADSITENDATSGNTDVARFDTGIATDQLWFRHVSNNLEVSIIGTSDKFTVTNWYLGSQYHVEQFKTSDGKMLLDSQVQNLVSAMAAFAPPAAGQTTLSASYAATLNPVIVANWQ